MTDTLILSTGRGTFDLLNPRAEDVNVDDMLRNLSRIVRFCGASPFSVLQHSLYVGRLLRAQGESRDVILAGFVHDLHEYITGDIAAPILDRLLIGLAWWAENMDIRSDRVSFLQVAEVAQMVIERKLKIPEPLNSPFGYRKSIEKKVYAADMASREFETTYDYLNVPELARDIVSMTPFACIEAYRAELADLGVTI